MCTVTYIPQKSGFILSSNRDESPTRAINHLDKEVIDRKAVLFPRDPKGGSWLFLSDRRQVVCVLNGAFVKHRHQPPYRQSRGLIAKSFFRFPDARSFFRDVNLIGIEPFTMIVADDSGVYEFRWDENVKHIRHCDPELCHIWSSSTLYTPEMQQKREAWFRNYLENNHPLSLEDVKYIHRNGNVGDPTQNYIMNRNDMVCTVSISHVIVKKQEARFEFEDLMDQTLILRDLDLHSNP